MEVGNGDDNMTPESLHFLKSKLKGITKKVSFHAVILFENLF